MTPAAGVQRLVVDHDVAAQEVADAVDVRRVAFDGHAREAARREVADRNAPRLEPRSEVHDSARLDPARLLDDGDIRRARRLERGVDLGRVVVLGDDDELRVDVRVARLELLQVRLDGDFVVALGERPDRHPPGDGRRRIGDRRRRRLGRLRRCRRQGGRRGTRDGGIGRTGGSWSRCRCCRGGRARLRGRQGVRHVRRGVALTWIAETGAGQERGCHGAWDPGPMATIGVRQGFLPRERADGRAYRVAFAFSCNRRRAPRTFRIAQCQTPF